MNVAEIMTTPAYPCSAQEPLSRAAQLMWDHDVGVVPVVDREGRAIAMITDRDICMAALTQGRPVSELRVEQATSRVVHTCHPDDRLSAAEHDACAPGAPFARGRRRSKVGGRALDQ